VGTALLARRVRSGEAIRLAAVVLAAALAARPLATTVGLRMTNIDVAAEQLGELARSDDLIVVVPWYVGITFARYYRGSAPWMSYPDFDEHEFHLHMLIREKMERGDAGVADELARVERALRAGGRLWIVGLPVAPPPGEPPPSLPPAPTGPTGWRAGPYLDSWELRLGDMLRSHANQVSHVPLPDRGRVNAWENLPLVVVEGWH
jgi:hypothetical protein